MRWSTLPDVIGFGKWNNGMHKVSGNECWRWNLVTNAWYRYAETTFRLELKYMQRQIFNVSVWC